ncbi:secreted Ly-6/uPAR-related protein 1-like [Lineus longissimus]|uniref:secreted Ly-6/uPAR-related protein 1-like n=1 Tax=Lineus longissimus TaxID=88925 RepID=UPI002B4F6A12
MFAKISAIILLFACFVGFSQALTCYKCSSANVGGALISLSSNGSSDGNTCKDPFVAGTNFTTETCTGYCVKTIGGAFGLEAFERSCKSSCVAADSDFFGIRAYTGCCQTDYCNSATFMSGSVALILSLAALVQWFQN